MTRMLNVHIVRFQIHKKKKSYHKLCMIFRQSIDLSFKDPLYIKANNCIIKNSFSCCAKIS